MVLKVELLPPRIQRYREATKRHFVRNDGKLGVTSVACIERARYMTESFKQTDGEAWNIRRAKAFANVLNKRTLFVLPDEILVGYIGQTPTSIPFYVECMPEAQLRDAIGSKLALTEDEWKELNEVIIPFWKGKTLEEKVLAAWPEELRKQIYPPEGEKYSFVTQYRWPEIAIISNLEKLFRVGMNGIKKQIADNKAKLQHRLSTLDYDQSKVGDMLHRQDEYNAMELMADAFINYVDRYSKCCSDAAAKETNPTRKAELEQMAKNLNIREPVKTMWQAVQFAWLDHTLHILECNTGGPFQRYDQLFYPYYKADLEAGRITKQQAKELVMELWLKYERAMGKLEPAASRASSAQGSNSLFQSITLGGVDPHGEDATNELSFLMMEVTGELQCCQPNITVRYHPKMSDEFLYKIWETTKTGMGMPSMFNEKPMFEHCMQRGMTVEDARNTSIAGCVALCLAHKNLLAQIPSSGAMNAAKMMEFALSDGVNLMTKQPEGIKTGDPTKFKRWEELRDALFAQMKAFWTPAYYSTQISKKVDRDMLPMAYAAIMNDKCIEDGLDPRENQDYNCPFFGLVSGIVDAADAIAAVRKLVFDDKKVTMEKMIEAVKANWKGYEDIRKMCQDAPKFGDDNPYVDLIVRDIFDYLNSVVRGWHDYTGAYYVFQAHSASTFMVYGNMTWALPNGRKAHEPCSDGGISPELGHGKEITKVLKSVAHTDAMKFQRILLNQRLNPNTTGKQYADIIRAWGDLSISQIQFNVFKTDTLREAQSKPENFPDLLVRIAGYSAVFVNLARPTQEAIISRSESFSAK